MKRSSLEIISLHYSGLCNAYTPNLGGNIGETESHLTGVMFWVLRCSEFVLPWPNGYPLAGVSGVNERMIKERSLEAHRWFTCTVLKQSPCWTADEIPLICGNSLSREIWWWSIPHIYPHSSPHQPLSSSNVSNTSSWSTDEMAIASRSTRARDICGAWFKRACAKWVAEPTSFLSNRREPPQGENYTPKMSGAAPNFASS